MNQIKQAASAILAEQVNELSTQRFTQYDTNLECNSYTINKNKETIIYVRVSTKEQNLEAQRDTCERFCKDNNLTVKQIITEHCSAYKDNSQKGLMCVLNENKNINLIVFSVDRFTRNTQHANQFINTMEKNNISLISIKEKISLDTSFGKHEFRKLVSASQFESELIAERVKNSVAFRKNNNIPMGRQTYGFKLFNGKVVKDFKEQAVIKFILSFSKKNTTIRKINAGISSLLKDHNMIENYKPLIISIEDDQFEYRTLGENESFTTTIKNIAEILNDYGIKKRNLPWNSSKVSSVIKNVHVMNIKSIKNMKV